MSKSTRIFYQLSFHFCVFMNCAALNNVQENIQVNFTLQL